MRKMYTLLFILSVLILCGYTNKIALELVTLQYPPYEFLEEGEVKEVKGVAVEIVEEVFKRMQRPINITLYSWDRSLDIIKKGEADAILTIFKTPEREVFADYSHEVLMPQIISLFVRHDSNIVFDGDLSKLSMYTFGVVRRVSYGSIFDDAVKLKVIQNIETSETGEKNMKKLLQGRCDILLSNRYGALDIVKNMNIIDQVKELTPALQSVPSYIAFSKKRSLASLRDECDIIVRQMKDDGTYDRIITSYFGK
jgi:polar amino acid transport system substrate-binding protein